MITTAAAILGSAAIAGVAGAVNNRNAIKSAERTAAETNAANAQLARENQANVTNLINPYLQPSYGATSAIADRLGLGTTRNILSDGGVVTMGPNGSMTSSPMTTRGQFDAAAYLQQNPDVAQAAQAFLAGGGDRQSYQGVTNAEDYAARHAQLQAQAEGRPVPVIQGTAQTAPTNYGGDYAPPTFVRPDQPAAPAMPDLSLAAYEKSPNYDWQLNEGQRNLNARAAAGGLLNSGAAARDAITYGSNLALGDFNNWRNNQLGQWQLQLGQFNADRNVLNDNFNQDRGFGYTSYADQRDTGYGRFDTQTNDLFRLSNQGLAAAGTVAGVNGNTTANLINGNNSQATTSANAALAGAANTNNLIGNLTNAVGYYYGNKSSPTATGGAYVPQTSYGPINPYRV